MEFESLTYGRQICHDTSQMRVTHLSYLSRLVRALDLQHGGHGFEPSLRRSLCSYNEQVLRHCCSALSMFSCMVVRDLLNYYGRRAISKAVVLHCIVLLMIRRSTDQGGR